MRHLLLTITLLSISLNAVAQSDIDLILFPEQYHQKAIFRADVLPVETVDEENRNEDVAMTESTYSLRYSLTHSETRDVYATLDNYWASINNHARFDETNAALPDDLYDVSAGLLFREELDNGWTLGGTLRVGSASDDLFDSSDEAYARSLTFLRVPHLEYTSWIFLLGLNTDGDFPLYPGIGYAFPISHRAYAVVGLPIIATGGQLTDKISFSAMLIPSSTTARIDYALTDRITPYLGYASQSKYFSRANRDDKDDSIRISDARSFAGSTVKVGERSLLDFKAGYIYDREFGEGDDYDERNDNNIEIDSAAFASVGFQYNF